MLAVNLAIVLSRLGHKVGLLDADVYGPNVPLTPGINAQPKVLPDIESSRSRRMALKSSPLDS